MGLISVEEAAKILGVSRTQAYRLAKDGKIPCVRSFGPLRVHAEKLQELIDAEADASMAGQSDTTQSRGPKGQAPMARPSQSAIEREWQELMNLARKKK
jgi:excisionase family DNA binding protein